jgi:hypothetical protein
MAAWCRIRLETSLRYLPRTTSLVNCRLHLRSNRLATTSSTEWSPCTMTVGLRIRQLTRIGYELQKLLHTEKERTIQYPKWAREERAVHKKLRMARQTIPGLKRSLSYSALSTGEISCRSRDAFSLLFYDWKERNGKEMEISCGVMAAENGSRPSRLFLLFLFCFVLSRGGEFGKGKVAIICCQCNALPSYLLFSSLVVRLIAS